MTPAFLEAFDALPTSGFYGVFRGKRYSVMRQDFSDGKSQKLVARELGGTDYISLNLYRLEGGAALRPCEMPAAKVVDFVLELKPLPDGYTSASA